MGILKKIRIVFQNFPKNVHNDLYKLFSKLLCNVNKSSYEMGGGQKQPSLQHLAVTLKINICRANFS